MIIPPDIFRIISGLPGEEIVLLGLRDLEAGKLHSCEVLLILMVRSRLIQAGLAFLDRPELDRQDIELDLYRSLGATDPDSAYGRYNSLRRRLDSFVRGLERRQEQATSSFGMAK